MRDGPLATLVRLFLLGAEVSRERLAEVFVTVPSGGAGGRRRPGADAGGRVRAVLDIRPHSDGARDLSGRVRSGRRAARTDPLRRDHVLGIGGASMSLARAVIRTPVRRALDLGTGCGIQALHLDGHCAEIVATDINERALRLAGATARLNGMSWDLRRGSLFEPVAGERFDLIVSNPPFVVGAGDRRLHLPGFRYGRGRPVPHADRTGRRSPEPRRHGADHGQLDCPRR